MTSMGKDSELPVNLHPTLGCCGLDCSLCPRYYTVSSSRCPGCYGLDFFSKHPSCPFITCCVKKKTLESCAQCGEFPCSRFKGSDRRDSFVTKQKSLSNLNMVKEGGLERFINRQGQQIKLLEAMLTEFNEGRSKSFYCLATALLPITDMEVSLSKADQEIRNNSTRPEDVKTKANILRRFLNSYANERGIELKLRN
ncbi:DUF3795 domain-containing protein [Chloroflexota bacterium]